MSKRLSEVLLVVVSISDCLVTASNLYVDFTEQCNVLAQASHVAVDSSLHVINLLVHETEIQVSGRDLRMIIAAAHFQNMEGSIHVLETFREVTTAVVVHS